MRVAEVERIYPEAKSALINWIEQNFHEIESYVFVSKLADGTTMTIHHVPSRVEAYGLLEIAKLGGFKKVE